MSGISNRADTEQSNPNPQILLNSTSPGGILVQKECWKLLIWKVLGLAFIVGAFAQPGSAQLNGFNIRGDMGSKAGTQAPEGMYVGAPFYWYDTNRINNGSGDQVNPSGSLNMFIGGPLFSWVTPKKIFGANYAFTVVLPMANADMEGARFGQNPSPGLSDMYVQPLNLGWHLKRADVIAGYGIYVPTGRYSDGANDNTGLGMWGHELFIGSTIYLDDAKKWHAASTASFEFHTQKKDSQGHVGNLMTLEGGLGRDFLKGAATVGVAYYAQWKLSNDNLTGLPAFLVQGKNSTTGIGPELSLPLATKKTVFGFFTLRYQWEVYAHTTTQGRGLNMMLIFPLKPIKIS
jgi:hypothetical protein